MLPVSLLLESSRLLRLVMPTQDEGKVPAQHGQASKHRLAPSCIC